MQYELSQLGVLSIQGDKAKTFLQGQLTCDLNKIDNINSSLGAHCNPKGRIISLFNIIMKNDVYYLIMPKDLVEITLVALKKYAIFFKVILADVSADWSVTGYDQATEANPNLSSIPLSVMSERVIQLTSTKPAINDESSAPLAGWINKNIAEGIPTIYAKTSGKLLPQELNLDAHGAISYDKGCYTGQEIIARMHYRGKAKSQVYHANVINCAKIQVGDFIYANANDPRECGIVIETCQDTHNLLIVLNDADAKDPNLFIHQPTDHLTIHSKE